jgi:nucleotide-binding universal stress UspA family protein
MTILCATDFSPSSDQALKLAGALAHRLGDTVTLVHAIQPLPVAYAAGTGWEVGVRAAADTLIEASLAQLRADGIHAEARVLFGSPAACILEAAADLAPRLLVMGTHGRKGMARLFVGSVARTVVQKAPCPVLVTRGDEPLPEARERWSSKQPLRVVLALDGTRASERAAAWLDQPPSGLAVAPTVVRLYWPAQELIRYGLDTDGDSHPALLRLLDRDVGRVLGSIPVDDRPVRYCEAHVNAADVLAREARALGPDALVVGMRHGGLEAWNALEVPALLAVAPCPVLCIPRGAAPAAQQALQIRALLVATDLSPPSNQAVPLAYGLLPLGGRVELCHVHQREHQPLVASSPKVEPPLDEAHRQALLDRLRALIPPEAEARGIVTNLSVIEGYTPAPALREAALRLDVDLLVLASHGRSGWKRAVLGSVAEEVSRQADRPVMIVHPRPC